MSITFDQDPQRYFVHYIYQTTNVLPLRNLNLAFDSKEGKVVLSSIKWRYTEVKLPSDLSSIVNYSPVAVAATWALWEKEITLINARGERLFKLLSRVISDALHLDENATKKYIENHL